MLYKKTFTKKAPDIFCIQVKDFNISDIFYKIQISRNEKNESRSANPPKKS